MDDNDEREEQLIRNVEIAHQEAWDARQDAKTYDFRSNNRQWAEREACRAARAESRAKSELNDYRSSRK